MKVTAASDSAALDGMLDANWRVSAAVANEVAAILADVFARGDAAIVECARRFDDDAFELSRLRVPIPMVETARAQIAPEDAAALELARERIARFHRRQRAPDVAYAEEDGSRYALQRRPLRSIAVYAQGARAAGVLMGAVPAKIAGVARVIVLAPPARGNVSPALLFACALCGVDELYAVGGAQAIGAAAFGTKTLARVDKIVGRAGRRTTEAKRQVYGRCGIDGLSGPPEVLVVADDGANSEYVVAELLAQAERPDVTRLAVLSESRSLLEAVAQLIDTLDLRTIERHDLVAEAIGRHCRLIEAGSRDELFDVLNRFATAYVSLQVRDAPTYLERINAAGIVFVGDGTPLVCGEYAAGVNYVAPTGGTARFASALSLADFTRSFSVVEYGRERMSQDASSVAARAEADGLLNSAQTARMRCDG